MVDLITKLPLVARKDAILVVCNRLFKITHFVATTEGTLVEGLARLFRDNIIMIDLSCLQYSCSMFYRCWGCFFMTQ